MSVRRFPLLVHRALLAALALLLGLLALASLAWPFSWDHGVFAWIGDAIVRGGMPYRDAWDVKGPLTFYVFAALERLAGKGMWGIRVFDLVALAAGMGAAVRVIRSLDGGGGAAAYVALVLALQYLGTGYFETAQPDAWAGFLLLLGLAPLVGTESKTTWRRAAGSAFLLGSALLLKPVYAVYGALPVTYVLLAHHLAPRERLRLALLSVAIFALPAGLGAGWFALRGAWHSLVETYVLFNLQQAGSGVPGIDTSLRGALPRFAHRITSTPALFLTCLAATFALATWRSNRRGLLLLLSATAASLFVTFIQQRYWNRYQWHPAYLMLGTLAGIGLGWLWRHPPGGPALRGAARAFAAMLAAAIVLKALPDPAEQAGRWLDLRLGRITRAQYDDQFGHPALSWTIADSRRLAAYLEAHTAPDDPVFVWSDPLVHWLSGRPSVGRFAFHVPVTAPVTTAGHRRNRAELLRALATHPPRYVAVARRSLDPADSLNEANIAHGWPRLGEWLLAGYEDVGPFGGMELYRRAAAPPSGP